MKIRVFCVYSLIATASLMLGGVAAADPKPPIAATEAPHNGAALAPTKPLVSISDAVANEGGSISFFLTLSKASTEVTSVKVSRTHLDTDSDDFALDFPPPAIFFPGQLASAVNFLVAGGDGTEPAELFKVELVDPVGLTIGDGVAIGTVLDGDGPALEVHDASANEGDASDGESLVFEVAASYAPLTDVSFDFSTGVIGFEAEPAVDFQPIDVVVTLPAGSGSVKVAVPVVGDGEVEEDELVTVSIQNPTAGSIGNDTALGTIVDDDQPSAPPPPTAPALPEPTEAPPSTAPATEEPSTEASPSPSPGADDAIPAAVTKADVPGADEVGALDPSSAPTVHDGPSKGQQRLPLALAGLSLAAALLSVALRLRRRPGPGSVPERPDPIAR